MTDVAENPPSPWPLPLEKRPRRYLVYPLLVAIIALYGYWQFSFFVPAYTGSNQAGSGTNQDGYLVTARLIAEEGHLGLVPKDAYEFVGQMMVMTPPPHPRFYAKYPFGYPLLAALARLGGNVVGWWRHDPNVGIYAMYLINPVCALAACLLSFFLFTRVVGNFTALMGTLLLVCNPIVLTYFNAGYSHSSTLLCVVGGFLCVLRWWQKGGKWIGFLGGLALGYACAIRYSEFLLLGPLLFAVCVKSRLDLRRLGRSMVPLLGWAIPIAAVALSLWIAYGRPWRTGYALCGEQTAFALKYFLGNSDPANGNLTPANWSTLLFHLNHLGLFLMLPLSILGIVGLFWHSWKLGILISLWVLPLTALYLFYYWGQGEEDATYYLRFFLTVLPGLLMAGLFALERAVPSGYGARALAIGIFTAGVCAINVVNILPQIEATQSMALAMRNIADLVHEKFPMNQGNVIFASEETCNQLDIEGGYRLYDVTFFSGSGYGRYKSALAPSRVQVPNPIQVQRSALMAELLANHRRDGTLVAKSTDEVDRLAEDLIDQALGRGQRVAFIFRGQTNLNMIKDRRDLKLRELGNWEEPPPTAEGIYTYWRNGRAQFPKPPTVLSSGERRAQTWHIYELEHVPLPGDAHSSVAGSPAH